MSEYKPFVFFVVESNSAKRRAFDLSAPSNFQRLTCTTVPGAAEGDGNGSGVGRFHTSTGTLQPSKRGCACAGFHTMGRIVPEGNRVRIIAFILTRNVRTNQYLVCRRMHGVQQGEFRVKFSGWQGDGSTRQEQRNDDSMPPNEGVPDVQEHARAPAAD